MEKDLKEKLTKSEFRDVFITRNLTPCVFIKKISEDNIVFILPPQGFLAINIRHYNSKGQFQNDDGTFGNKDYDLVSWE